MQFKELALLTREHFDDWDPLDTFDPAGSGGAVSTDETDANTTDEESENEANIKGDSQ